MKIKIFQTFIDIIRGKKRIAFTNFDKFKRKSPKVFDIKPFFCYEEYLGNDIAESLLHEQFKKHKGYLSTKVENFLPIYDRIFSYYQNKNIPVKLLEVGILNGGYLEICQKCLPKGSKFTGVDIAEACKTFKYDESVKVLVGDISKGELVNDELKEETFDIIIDDASHFCDNVISNFENLFEKLNFGGTYIIEDVCTSYWGYYGGGYKKNSSTIEYFKNLADVVNFTYIDKNKIPKDKRVLFEKLSKEIASVTFYDSVIVIEKYSKPKEKPFRNYLTGEEGLVVPKKNLLEYGLVECNGDVKFEKFMKE